MLYAIKADDAVVYVGCAEDLKDEYKYHQRKMLEVKQDDMNAPDDFYFMLDYWKNTEHKKIRMVELDIGDEDEEIACKILVKALRPIGNVVDWEVHWGE